MPDLRLAAYAAAVAAFAGFAVWGLRGWLADGGERHADPAHEPDEIPLSTGFVADVHKAHYANMGYPWFGVRAEMLALKANLPKDPAPVDTEEAEKKNRVLLSELRFEMPSGRVPWKKYFEVAKSRIEPHGVKVQTGEPRVPDDYPVELPAKEWTGLEIFGHVMIATHRDIVYDVTSEGVAVGRDLAVNRARREATLVGLRRRVAAEHADPALDAEFRPDFVDADIVKFVRGTTAQTGVDIAMDPAIWDSAYALAWRGRPRKLREALDELCTAFHWYWRWNGERVWLLKP
jgi:hypothetical protein